MGGFRAPSEAEIEEILYWLRLERRSNVRSIVICVSVVVVAALAVLIVGLFQREMLSLAALLGVLAIPSVLFAIKNTLTENEKVEGVQSGKAMIVEPRIREVCSKYFGPHAHYPVVSADFREEQAVKSQDFVISKRIYKQMKREPKGFVVKYPDSGNRWLKRQYVFVPSSH